MLERLQKDLRGEEESRHEYQVEQFDMEIPDKRDNSAFREDLIIQQLTLVKRVAIHIHNRLPDSIQLDDLVSTGVLGLIDAVEKYDPTKGKSFKRYVELRVRGAILDELRSYDFLSRSSRKRANKIEQAAKAIESEKGRPPTEEELADSLGCSLSELQSLINNTRSYVFIDIDDFQQVIGEDKVNMIRTYSSEEDAEPFRKLAARTAAKELSRLLQKLPENLYLVLSLYYYSELNYKEIGQVLDLSESRISQLHKKAIGKLKKLLQGVDV